MSGRFLRIAMLLGIFFCFWEGLDLNLIGLCTKTPTFPQSFVQEGILHKKVWQYHK